MNVAEREVARLKEKYVNNQIDFEEFERALGAWLVWEKLLPDERRKFELEWAANEQRRISGTDSA